MRQSPSGLPGGVGTPVFLAQTDTTVGLLSADASRLSLLKGRPEGKPFLLAVPDLHTLKEQVRVPGAFRGRVRHSRQVTFIYPGAVAVRVVAYGHHHRMLARFGPLFSTSANRAGEALDIPWAAGQVNIEVTEPEGYRVAAPSRLIRLGRKRSSRLR